MFLDRPATKVYHVKQKSCDGAPSEELVTTIIHFADGATAQIGDGTTIGGFSDTGIIGTDGDLRLVGDEITLVTHGDPDPNQRPGNRSQVVQKFQVPEQGKVLTTIGRVFAEAVRSGDGRRLISFRQIRHEYQILEAMLESAKTGQVADVK
jgi:predicted dehydrogenase